MTWHTMKTVRSRGFLLMFLSSFCTDFWKKKQLHKINGLIKRSENVEHSQWDVSKMTHYICRSALSIGFNLYILFCFYSYQLLILKEDAHKSEHKVLYKCVTKLWSKKSLKNQLQSSKMWYNQVRKKLFFHHLLQPQTTYLYVNKAACKIHNQIISHRNPPSLNRWHWIFKVICLHSYIQPVLCIPQQPTSTLLYRRLPAGIFTLKYACNHPSTQYACLLLIY